MFHEVALAMPVSYLPVITPLLFIGVPLLFLPKGKRRFAVAALVSACLFAVLVLSVYVPGWILMARARRGNPAAQYELARWTETHCERINAFILWPCSPDVLGGYAWLEKAAAQDYPPALWLVGVRLKYGIHVPEPPGWQGPTGNVFPQPSRGQALIDRAVARGYRPPGNEKDFYGRVYRR